MSQVSLNSTRFSRSSCKLTLAGITVLGFGPPKWRETIGGDLMYLNSPVAFGKVVGEVKSEIEIAMLPEMLDTIKQGVGVGYGEISLPLTLSLYEPGNPAGIYQVSNDACWLGEDAFDGAAEGALSTLKLTGQMLTNWNGVTALDLAARAISPGSIGSLFAAAGLSL